MSGKTYQDIDFQSLFKGKNAVDPTSAQDLATKNYADNLLAGMSNKQTVRVATTVAGTLATSFENGDTVDGVVLATGDRILVKDQASGSENGIRIVAASGAPARATDADSAAEFPGMFVNVQEGTTNADTFWQLTTNAPIVVNTTALVFAKFQPGVTYTADGNGIELSGTQFALELDGTTLSKGSSGLRVGSGAAGAGLTESSGVLAVGVTAPVTVAADAIGVDTSAGGLARWNTALGAGSAGATIVQAHGFGHKVICNVFVESSGEDITSGVTVTCDNTNITVTFGASQADRSLFRLVWVG